jgi:hypothetical protein
MSAPTSPSAAPRDAPETAEAPTLLDALARAPAAAALVVAALERAEDRKALRLAHPQLRDAVGEAATKLKADFQIPNAARPPTARRWPRLEELRMYGPPLAAIEALGADPWGHLHTLRLGTHRYGRPVATELDLSSARALVSALRRLPLLRTLDLRLVALPGAHAALFAALPGASRAEALPQLRGLTSNIDLGAGGSAVGRLGLSWFGPTTGSLLSLANAPWPREELNLPPTMSAPPTSQRPSLRRTLPSVASTSRIAS